MLDRSDNQDVGLEAAIIERVRNSSLVEWLGAENVTGLKPNTEAAGSIHKPAHGGCTMRPSEWFGRGAS